MFCYVDRYFVILFRLLHFLFQRDSVSFHWFLNMTSFHRNRYTQIIYIYIITDYIICVYAVYMLMYTYTYMYVYMCVCVYVYIYMCGNTAYRAIEPLRITAREIP